MHPDFKGGWRCTLEAAITHHDTSHTTAIGCSPHFAAYRSIKWLPADVALALPEPIVLKEKARSRNQQHRHRNAVNEGYDRRHGSPMPDIQRGTMVLGRKGIQGSKAHIGHFLVTKTYRQQRILTTIYCERSNGPTEITTIGNVVPYHLRRDGNKAREDIRIQQLEYKKKWSQTGARGN